MGSFLSGNSSKISPDLNTANSVNQTLDQSNKLTDKHNYNIVIKDSEIPPADINFSDALPDDSVLRTNKPLIHDKYQPENLDDTIYNHLNTISHINKVNCNKEHNGQTNSNFF